MTSTQGNQFTSIQNADTFLDDHAAELGGVATSATRAAVKEAVRDAADHANLQNGHLRTAKSAVATHARLRTILMRDHMAPIASVAALKVTDKEELLSLSLPRNHPASVTLAALANGMANAAEPYAATFIEAGLAPDFIQALRTAANGMLDAPRVRATSKQAVRQASTALHNTLVKGRKAVKVIDRFVTSTLGGKNPELLAAWKLAKRVPRGRGGLPATMPIATAPSAPAAAATPTVSPAAPSASAAA